MHALGTHLLIDLNDCNPEILDDLHGVRDAMVAAAREAEAIVLEGALSEYEKAVKAYRKETGRIYE